MGIDTFTDMEARERLEAQQDARDAQDDWTFYCEPCGRTYPGSQYGGMDFEGTEFCAKCWEWWRCEGWKS